VFQVHLSWDPDEDTALAMAHDQWRSNVFGTGLNWNLELPSQFDEAAKFVAPGDVRGSVIVSSDLGYHIDRLGELADLGADVLFLHHVGQEQEAFIEAFAEKVLPEIAS
ncbi:MAG TPA: LLM class F420-dependent oxidoreductase, partial [Actinomycetota bacterium]|nr:LLM class F420-dependent oxidoreductase [Actinomycetota bacterium]